MRSHYDPFLIRSLKSNLKTGQERFGNMTKAYYRGAAGAFVVFDVTRSSSFAAVEAWKRDLDSKVGLFRVR